MKYKVPKKEPVSRIGFECSSRFKFKPGMSVFLCQSEICCFVRCSECWASFLTSVPSDGIHQQFSSLLPTHKHIHQHFFDTKASPTRLSSLRMWSARLLSLGLCSDGLWHAVAFQQVTGHVSWEKQILSIFCVAALRPWSVRGHSLVLWIWLTVNRAESFWKLVLSSALLSVRHIFFLLRAGRVWNGTTALL